MAQLQLALGVGAASEILDCKGVLNAIVVVYNTFAVATGDRCGATTLETLETRGTVRVTVAVTWGFIEEIVITISNSFSLTR